LVQYASFIKVEKKRAHVSHDVEVSLVVQRLSFNWWAHLNFRLAVKAVKKILLAGFFVGAQSAFAMSFQDAGENILYFEHARLSAEHCEQRGIAARPAFQTWWQENLTVYRQSNQSIRGRAADGGLSKADQELMVTASTENQRRLAQDHISKKGVNCGDFKSVLKMYSNLLKK
jgi:hypothetical protein